MQEMDYRNSWNLWVHPVWNAFLSNPAYYYYCTAKAALLNQSAMVRKSSSAARPPPAAIAAPPALPFGALAVGGNGINGALKRYGIEECPQCKISFDASNTRPVQDSCGHFKCRNCFISNEECPQCKQKEKSQRVVNNTQNASPKLRLAPPDDSHSTRRSHTLNLRTYQATRKVGKRVLATIPRLPVQPQAGYKVVPPLLNGTTVKHGDAGDNEPASSSISKGRNKKNRNPGDILDHIALKSGESTTTRSNTENVRTYQGTDKIGKKTPATIEQRLPVQRPAAHKVAPSLHNGALLHKVTSPLQNGTVVHKVAPPLQNGIAAHRPTPPIQNGVAVQNGDIEDDNEPTSSSVVQIKDKKKKKRNPVIIHDHITVISGEPTMFQCNVCMKKFKTKAHIKYHEFCQNGSKPFKCDQCGQGFIAKSHYEYHLRTHTGERPYVCPKCGKGFNQRGKVTRHMRSHTGEKPFVCTECGRGFANAQALRSHHLIHTGERPFACKYCNKRFTGMTNLKKHIITHTGERPYVCTHCNKSFGLKWTLDLHLRTHSSERPYACDQCTRAFSNSKDLRRHLVIHSGERPFKCWICGTAFRRKDNLDRHIKNTHNQPKEVAKHLANEAAAEYLALNKNSPVPASKVNSAVISNVIRVAQLSSTPKASTSKDSLPPIPKKKDSSKESDKESRRSTKQTRDATVIITATLSPRGGPHEHIESESFENYILPDPDDSLLGFASQSVEDGKLTVDTSAVDGFTGFGKLRNLAPSDCGIRLFEEGPATSASDSQLVELKSEMVDSPESGRLSTTIHIPVLSEVDTKVDIGQNEQKMSSGQSLTVTVVYEDDGKTHFITEGSLFGNAGSPEEAAVPQDAFSPPASPISPELPASPEQLVTEQRSASQEAHMSERSEEAFTSELVPVLKGEHDGTQMKAEEERVHTKAEGNEAQMEVQELQVEKNVDEEEAEVKCEEVDLPMQAEQVKAAMESGEEAIRMIKEARIKALEEDATEIAEQEEVRMIVQEVEARMNAQDEEVRIKTQEEEARIKAQEEEARIKTQEEEARIKVQQEEARIKARQELARVKVQEEDARMKAQEEEARVKALEEEARVKAQEEEARLKVQEEDARMKAQEEEARVKALEEEARIKAQEEEARAKAVEEEARVKALEEEARAKAVEEEARVKAQEKEARLKALEEEARLKALEEEARVKALEEESRLKALEEEARVKALKEEARVKAEEIRLKAEQVARMKAEEEARLKAEEETRLQAEEVAHKIAQEEARIKSHSEAEMRAQEEEVQTKPAVEARIIADGKKTKIRRASATQVELVSEVVPIALEAPGPVSEEAPGLEGTPVLELVSITQEGPASPASPVSEGVPVLTELHDAHDSQEDSCSQEMRVSSEVRVSHEGLGDEELEQIFVEEKETQTSLSEKDLGMDSADSSDENYKVLIGRPRSILTDADAETTAQQLYAYNCENRTQEASHEAQTTTPESSYFPCPSELECMYQQPPYMYEDVNVTAIPQDMAERPQRSESSYFNLGYPSVSGDDIRFCYQPANGETFDGSTYHPSQIGMVPPTDSLYSHIQPNNVNILYASATARAERNDDESGPPLKIRLLCAEALGVHQGAEPSDQHIFYTATRPNQEVQDLSNPAFSLAPPAVIHPSTSESNPLVSLLQYAHDQNAPVSQMSNQYPVQVSYANGVTHIQTLSDHPDRSRLMERARELLPQDNNHFRQEWNIPDTFSSSIYNPHSQSRMDPAYSQAHSRGETVYYSHGSVPLSHESCSEGSSQQNHPTRPYDPLEALAAEASRRLGPAKKEHYDAAIAAAAAIAAVGEAARKRREEEQMAREQRRREIDARIVVEQQHQRDIRRQQQLRPMNGGPRKNYLSNPSNYQD